MTGRFELAKGEARTHLGDRDIMAVACAARLLDGNHEKRVDIVGRHPDSPDGTTLR
jgi:hypothetical protein